MRFHLDSIGIESSHSTPRVKVRSFSNGHIKSAVLSGTSGKIRNAPTSLNLETDIPPVLFIFVVVYPNSGEVSIFSGLLQEAKQHDILLVSSRDGLDGGTLGIGSLGVGSLGIQGRIVTSTEVVSISS